MVVPMGRENSKDDLDEDETDDNSSLNEVGEDVYPSVNNITVGSGIEGDVGVGGNAIGVNTEYQDIDSVNETSPLNPNTDSLEQITPTDNLEDEVITRDQE